MSATQQVWWISSLATQEFTAMYIVLSFYKLLTQDNINCGKCMQPNYMEQCGDEHKAHIYINS